jgi:hypothetical protein
MSNTLNDLLHSLTGNFASGLRISEDRRTVTLNLLGPAADFILIFEHPNPETQARIKAREGAAYAVPVRIRIVNRKSGKDVRGFGVKHLNPYWIRRFVYEAAAAVAWMEREWDIMSPEYVEMVDKSNQEDDDAATTD